MVVEVIDQFDILTDKAKDHSPIAGHADRPKARQIALERVEPHTRSVHVIRLQSDVQRGKYPTQSANVISPYTLGIAGLVEGLEAFMSEGFDHEVIVNPCFTPCQLFLYAMALHSTPLLAAGFLVLALVLELAQLGFGGESGVTVQVRPGL